jgi:Ca-activated chloride channel family protein
MAGSKMDSQTEKNKHIGPEPVTVNLEARPERQLIRPSGSFRHIVYYVRVGKKSRRDTDDRPPLNLALVLDRSGSIAGGKIDTAKRSALAVLDRLDERD